MADHENGRSEPLLWVGEMAQQVKELTAVVENPNLISRTCVRVTHSQHNHIAYTHRNT